MRSWQKIILGIMLLLIAGFGVLGWLVTSVLKDLCKNELLSETLSPNRQTRAVVFQRNCGATTDFSTQVSMLPINQALPNESGNLLTVNADYGKAPSGTQGRPEVKIQWRNDKILNISYHKAASVFQMHSKIRDIAITYSSFD